MLNETVTKSSEVYQQAELTRWQLTAYETLKEFVLFGFHCFMDFLMGMATCVLLGIAQHVF